MRVARAFDRSFRIEPRFQHLHLACERAQRTKHFGRPLAAERTAVGGGSFSRHSWADANIRWRQVLANLLTSKCRDQLD